MNVSINKQLKSCQNCFGVLSCFCKENFHTTFSAPNISAGNITLCGVQHAAREPRFERACFRDQSIILTGGCFTCGYIRPEREFVNSLSSNSERRKFGATCRSPCLYFYGSKLNEEKHFLIRVQNA
jgi:hypothetical protein